MCCLIDVRCRITSSLLVSTLQVGCATSHPSKVISAYQISYNFCLEKRTLIILIIAYRGCPWLNTTSFRRLWEATKSRTPGNLRVRLYFSLRSIDWHPLTQNFHLMSSVDVPSHFYFHGPRMTTVVLFKEAKQTNWSVSIRICPSSADLISERTRLIHWPISRSLMPNPLQLTFTSRQYLKGRDDQQRQKYHLLSEI